MKPVAPKETPLMTQYNSFKKKYPDAILLFRMGDFYETFGNDAIIAAGVLGITLTKRHNGAASETELAGFPHHALDMYLPRLVRAGHRVAICEQLEDPKLAKTIVKRGVTEIVTPGTALGDKMLDHTTNNYLCAVAFGKHEWGIAFTDLSTGEFLTAQGSSDYIDKLLQGFQPSEIIYPKGKQKEFAELFGKQYYLYPLDEWLFAHDFTRDKLLKHFQMPSLKGFGVDDLHEGISAAGAILHYLSTTEHPYLQHITALSRLHEDRYVWLDRFTVRNLELINSPHETGKPLVSVLDKTISPMGARLLKKWVVLPLKEQHAIAERLEIVELLIQQTEVADLLRQQIRQIGDIERLIAKVPLQRINPRQVQQIGKALQALRPIKELCLQSDNPHLKRWGEQINLCESITERISQQLCADPAAAIGKGDVIAAAVSADLDELRHLQHSGKEYLIEIQQREIERTGIPSLKIGFNNVFGYYLEVTAKYKDKTPPEWLRRQTLVNAERYITEELKRYEEKIFSAEEKILQHETELFAQLVADLNGYIRPIQLNSSLIARLDCLLSFADVSARYNYSKPIMDDSLRLDIKQGRHPVIERQLQLGEDYVPNDVLLDSDEQQILLITGPNMSGKSALLRQTALIVLMAQIGCFVPAAAAQIGLVDKIFTRVGASDNISSGESTFMVEMTETASIMHNLSPRSLILLDEIGRGTSTYDGISIAWALAEYLHQHPKAAPKTLFATHYHELTELADQFERIRNYNVAVKEAGNKVIFLRKLVEGGAERSFGIHVAQMAGMPAAIVQRAHQILAELEMKHINADDADALRETLKSTKSSKKSDNYQLNIFEMGDPQWHKIREILMRTDINALTPIEALIRLSEMKKIADAK
ncbi:MAG: DNA mismatch repair protein MutS [Sphingobacteriales bacterium]|nr:DNA mismatch repair protein MutS [Sphingobacteriales bacterium]